MKIIVDFEHYRSMFNLGIEMWVPRFRTWKKFQVALLIGPFSISITLGSRAQYNTERRALNEVRLEV